MNEIDEMLKNKDAADSTEQTAEAYEIKLVHMVTELKDTVSVYGHYTLGQVAELYGSQIGLHPGNKLWFYNLQAYPKTNTPDQSLTVAEFGVGPGDSLGISDECSVAAG